VAIGFKREELKARYDVKDMREDDWHTYSGQKTAALLARHLSPPMNSSRWLLNAGAGIYEVCRSPWKEVALDLFIAPILSRKYAVCASVERLPFQAGTFGGIVCVGEVLAYCDPATAITEFARLLAPSGILICDFSNSCSFRYWFEAAYGRAADLITEKYNGTPERTWVYGPTYVKSILLSSGFTIKAQSGTHTWSALARRIGASIPVALFLQRRLEWLRLPARWADLTTIVAVRAGAGRESQQKAFLRSPYLPQGSAVQRRQEQTAPMTKCSPSSAGRQATQQSQ